MTFLAAFWKAIRWRVLAALVLLALGFLLGRAGSGPSQAELRSRDSLRLASRALDQALRQADSLRAAANAASARAVAEATTRHRAAQARTDSGLQVVERLVPDTGAVRRAVEGAKADLAAERQADSVHIAALEADTAQKATAILGLLNGQRLLTDQRNAAQRQLDEALQHRQEPAVTLGATGGYGGVLSGGRLATGFGAAVGVTVRIHIRLPLLGG